MKKLKVKSLPVRKEGLKFKVWKSHFQLSYFKLSLIIISVSFSNFISSQTTPGSFSFSLQQAVDYALQNNTKVQNAKYDEEIAKNKVKEVTGIGLPQINGSFDVRDFIEIPTQLVPGEFFGAPPGTYLGVQFGTQYNAVAGIEASQLLFDGTYIVALQATKTFTELSQKASSRTKTETAVAVSKAYYSVLVNDERKKLLDANVARLKKLTDDTKALNENGFVEKIDVDRITVAFNNLLVEQEKVTKLLELGVYLLKYQMGMPQTDNLTLTDNLESVNFQPTNFSLEKFNYSSRIEFSLMETQKNAMQLQLKRERFSYMPNLILYGSGSANAMRNKFDIFDTKQRWYPTVVVGARLGVPIFDGLQKNYRIQQAKLNLLKAENDMKFVQQSIDLELSASRIALQNASSAVETQKKNIILAEEISRVAKIKYDQGIGSNLEVLNAETSLKEAQVNYFSALYDAIIAKIDYEKANGILVK